MYEKKRDIEKKCGVIKKEVPGMGLEPTRPNGHMALNHACLPIPAPGRVFLMTCKEKPISDYGKKVKRKT